MGGGLFRRANPKRAIREKIKTPNFCSRAPPFSKMRWDFRFLAQSYCLCYVSNATRLGRSSFPGPSEEAYEVREESSELLIWASFHAPYFILLVTCFVISTLHCLLIPAAHSPSKVPSTFVLERSNQPRSTSFFHCAPPQSPKQAVLFRWSACSVEGSASTALIIFPDTRV